MVMVSIVHWQPTGRLIVQAYWLGTKVDTDLAPCCIHCMNWVNSRNAFSVMTAPWRISWWYCYYWLARCKL